MPLLLLDDRGTLRLLGPKWESFRYRSGGSLVTSGYGAFKQEVGEAVVALFDPIRQRYEELRSDPAELERLLGVGAEKASAVSMPTLEQMYERMGFVRP